MATKRAAGMSRATIAIIGLGVIVAFGVGRASAGDSASTASATGMCPKCEPAPIVSEVPSRPKVNALCINGSERLVMHVAIEAKYTGKRAPTPSTSATLWQLSCNKRTRECDGAILNLDKGGDTGIGLLDLGTMVGARLTAVQGQVATITWGGMRTFTIDFAARKVRYAESSDELEGRGEGDCPER